ncbi:hypothetical protein HMI56_003344 [Coelomomyces lativittatus]|nr:hypothetical protein HMI56_003344 [Coelomomyces lativittatus]
MDCKDQNDKLWKREKLVTFQHEETSKHLSTFHEFAYKEVVPGQLEVSAEGRINENTYWKAEEGVYFKLETNLGTEKFSVVSHI